jgi:hypothetical protein
MLSSGTLKMEYLCRNIMTFLQKLIIGIRWQLRWVAFRNQVITQGVDSVRTLWGIAVDGFSAAAQGLLALVLLPVVFPFKLLLWLVQPISNFFQLDDERFLFAKDHLSGHGSCKADFEAFLEALERDGDELYKTLTFSDFRLITVEWDQADNRRCVLVEKRLAVGSRTPDEEMEFQNLQRLFDLHRTYFLWLRTGSFNLIDDATLRRLKEEDELGS